jgi:hypothetical protein
LHTADEMDVRFARHLGVDGRSDGSGGFGTTLEKIPLP